MKSARLILFFAVAIFLAQSSRAELADGVKAIVNDTVITYAEVQDFTAPAAESLQRQYAGQPDLYSQKLAALLNDGLDQLVERELILHDFDVSGYKLPDSVVDELVADRIRERFGDRVTLMKTLQAQGMTFEEFRKEVRDQWVEAQMRRKNVSQEIIISPFKVENYYETHQDDFKVEDEIQLRMIILNKTSAADTNTLPLANEILAKIKAGATFQEMASVYSQGSQQKEDGDWYERSALRKELADAAFALKPGQVSDVIETPESDYIMVVDQIHPAHVKPLGDIRDDIEKTLRTQEQTRIEKQWIEQLKKKAFIRIIP
jgi:peptidyl-prolyl cis-trans isomerase SurA